MVRGYEKIICACGFLFLFANVGLPSTAFSVYQPYLVDLPGVGDAGASLIISVRMALSLAAMFVVDRYFERLDCRLGIALACASTAAGFALYAAASACGWGLAGFFAGAALAGFGYGFGGMAAITLLAGRWYRTRVGTAVGVASLGSGVSSIVLPPLVLMLIEGASLSLAFAVEAVLALAIAAAVWALVRNRPADLGLLPHGAGEGDGGAAPAKASAAPAGRAPEGGQGPLRSTRILMIAAMFFVGAVSIVLYELFAGQIIHFFIAEPQTMALGTAFLRARILATPLMFCSFFIVHLFQGFGEGGKSLLLVVIRWLILNIPMLFILNHFIGMYGIVWAQVTADVINVIVSVIIFRRYA